MKTMRINMAQMHKWKVTQCNVKYFDTIHVCGGTFATLDPSRYVDLLCEFGIFYTLS